METIFETSELLIVNKPAGLPSSRGEIAHSAEEWGESQGLFLIHRLDPATSGALAFAKSEAALEKWRKAWTSGSVEKIYRAIVSGTFAPISIRFPIAHHPKSAKRMVALTPELESLPAKNLSRNIRGEPRLAVTEVIAVHPIPQDRSDVTVKIISGARHQIRVHLSAIEHPVVGDTIYQGVKNDRLLLHAWQISFKDLGKAAIAPLPIDWP